MITWIQLWPLMPMPTVILSALAAIPTLTFNGRVLGGGPVREYYLNHLVVPLLPSEDSFSLVRWFATASAFQEWLFALAVTININALMLPLLYVFGIGVIRTSSWFAKKNIQLKRDALR